MSKKYIITEHKPVVYSYVVYARSKKEAWAKFNNHENYEEIGLAPGTGRIEYAIYDNGVAKDTCAVCGKSFSPNNVGDYRCKKCESR